MIAEQRGLFDALDRAALIQGAIGARLRAESGEIEAAPDRWLEADYYAELSQRGDSERTIATACGTNDTTVHHFIRCARCFPREAPERAGSFWHAYQIARSDKAHVANNAGDNEWYTPADYIAAARDVMGGIDLDPASSAEANRVVGAERFFSPADDGLAQPWAGRVWMNPPYAQPHVERFCVKLAAEYEGSSVEAACVLVNNATETTWFDALAGVAAAVCFPRGRVRFWHTERESATPLQGQAVVYLGQSPERFVTTFSRFGHIWLAAERGRYDA